MNKYDTNNLNFILSLNQEQFIAWYDTASADDILYASEIMTKASHEIVTDEVYDTTEANAILKGFML